jgi:hypothetical protein
MNKNALHLVSALALLGLVAGVTSATGCGSSASALCSDVCNCQRCTSNDLDKCKSDADAAAQTAASAGCSSQFDDLLACEQKNLTCKNDRAVAPGCETEAVALAKCSSGINIFGADACLLASSHLSTCLGVQEGSGSGGQTAACTGTALCAAGCINAADCTAIKDAFSGMPTDASKPFLDCTTKCATAK